MTDSHSHIVIDLHGSDAQLVRLQTALLKDFVDGLAGTQFTVNATISSAGGTQAPSLIDAHIDILIGLGAPKHVIDALKCYKDAFLVSDLLRLTKRQVLNLPKVGTASVNKLERALAKENLGLRPDPLDDSPA